MRIGYCTNVHAGTTPETITANLLQYAVPLRARLRPDALLDVGMWWPASLAARLVEDPVEFRRYARFFDEHGLAHFTVNAFPHGDFHQQRVKQRVYEPDWTTEARCEYTRNVARLLAQLLPPGAHGTISTLAGGFREHVPPEAAGGIVRRNLLDMARFLETLERRSGRCVRLCLEPEPFTTVENAQEAASLFDLLGKDARQYLGLCYDVCHHAVVFESAAWGLRLLSETGTPVYKMQVSCAPRAEGLGAGDPRLETLGALCEERYLHQTFVRTETGELQRFPDLPDAIRALESGACGRNAELRTHFHVPVYAETVGSLRTTQDNLRSALSPGIRPPECAHFEVETYTWDVLPTGSRGTPDEISLVASLERELNFTALALGADA